jgi:hypothetical protein
LRLPHTELLHEIVKHVAFNQRRKGDIFMDAPIEETANKTFGELHLADVRYYQKRGYCVLRDDFFHANTYNTNK